MAAGMRLFFMYVADESLMSKGELTFENQDQRFTGQLHF